jgi:hypothetical protein
MQKTIDGAEHESLSEASQREAREDEPHSVEGITDKKTNKIREYYASRDSDWWRREEIAEMMVSVL